MYLSSDVLIDFGLNLAGYVIAGILFLVVWGRRERRIRPPKKMKVSPPPKSTVTLVAEEPGNKRTDFNPEFIPLANSAQKVSNISDNKRPDLVSHESKRGVPVSFADRKENRRAIYQEARRLLASGRPQSDLLQQLPLTEGELDMLSVAGRV
jgi:hypothetical protein